MELQAQTEVVLSCRSAEEFITLSKHAVRRCTGPSKKIETAFGELRACHSRWYSDLVLSSLHDATDKTVVRQVWKHVWYNNIVFCRQRVLDATHGASQRLDQARVALQNVIMAGILFYKTLIVQAQYLYGNVGTTLDLDERVRQKAILSLGKCTPQTLPASQICADFVVVCLTKIGDLMRYAAGLATSPAPYWRSAASFYKQALTISPNNGTLHNQLAVVAEGLGGAATAVVQFALAVSAAAPFDYALSNWIRCMGQCRSQTLALLRHHSLATLLPTQVRFRHLLNICQLLMSCAFGSAVDSVDLDKCEERWLSTQTALERLLRHPSCVASTLTNAVDDDYRLLMPLYACVTTWLADKNTASASRGELPKKQAIATMVHRMLLRTATIYTLAATEALTAINGSYGEVSSSDAANMERLLTCLRLLLTRFIVTVSDATRSDVHVKSPSHTTQHILSILLDSSETESLMKALADLVAQLRPARLSVDPSATSHIATVAASPSPSHATPSAIYMAGCAQLEEDEVVRGCLAFIPDGSTDQRVGPRSTPSGSVTAYRAVMLAQLVRHFAMLQALLGDQGLAAAAAGRSAAVVAASVVAAIERLAATVAAVAHLPEDARRVGTVNQQCPPVDAGGVSDGASDDEDVVYKPTFVARPPGNGSTSGDCWTHACAGSSLVNDPSDMTNTRNPAGESSLVGNSASISNLLTQAGDTSNMSAMLPAGLLSVSEPDSPQPRRVNTTMSNLLARLPESLSSSFLEKPRAHYPQQSNHPDTFNFDHRSTAPSQIYRGQSDVAPQKDITPSIPSSAFSDIAPQGAWLNSHAPPAKHLRDISPHTHGNTPDYGHRMRSPPMTHTSSRNMEWAYDSIEAPLSTQSLLYRSADSAADMAVLQTATDPHVNHLLDAVLANDPRALSELRFLLQDMDLDSRQQVGAALRELQSQPASGHPTAPRASYYPPQEVQRPQSTPSNWTRGIQEPVSAVASLSRANSAFPPRGNSLASSPDQYTFNAFQRQRQKHSLALSPPGSVTDAYGQQAVHSEGTGGGYHPYHSSQPSSLYADNAANPHAGIPRDGLLDGSPEWPGGAAGNLQHPWSVNSVNSVSAVRSYTRPPSGTPPPSRRTHTDVHAHTRRSLATSQTGGAGFMSDRSASRTASPTQSFRLHNQHSHSLRRYSSNESLNTPAGGAQGVRSAGAMHGIIRSNDDASRSQSYHGEIGRYHDGKPYSADTNYANMAWHASGPSHSDGTGYGLYEPPKSADSQVAMKNVPAEAPRSATKVKSGQGQLLYSALRAHMHAADGDACVERRPSSRGSAVTPSRSGEGDSGDELLSRAGASNSEPVGEDESAAWAPKYLGKGSFHGVLGSGSDLQRSIKRNVYTPPASYED